MAKEQYPPNWGAASLRTVHAFQLKRLDASLAMLQW
jgi:hypothetical protein